MPPLGAQYVQVAVCFFCPLGSPMVLVQYVCVCMSSMLQRCRFVLWHFFIISYPAFKTQVHMLSVLVACVEANHPPTQV
jgi:hypothetical protein